MQKTVLNYKRFINRGRKIYIEVRNEKMDLQYFSDTCKKCIESLSNPTLLVHADMGYSADLEFNGRHPAFDVKLWIRASLAIRLS